MDIKQKSKGSSVFYSIKSAISKNRGKKNEDGEYITETDYSLIANFNDDTLIFRFENESIDDLQYEDVEAIFPSAYKLVISLINNENNVEKFSTCIFNEPDVIERKEKEKKEPTNNNFDVNEMVNNIFSKVSDLYKPIINNGNQPNDPYIRYLEKQVEDFKDLTKSLMDKIEKLSDKLNEDHRNRLDSEAARRNTELEIKLGRLQKDIEDKEDFEKSVMKKFQKLNQLELEIAKREIAADMSPVDQTERQLNSTLNSSIQEGIELAKDYVWSKIKDKKEPSQAISQADKLLEKANQL